MTFLHFRHSLADIFDKVFTTPYFCFVWKNAGVQIGSNCRFWGAPVLHKATGSSIFIGNHFKARSRVASNSVGTIQPVVLSTTGATAILHIGNDVAVSGCTVACRQEIRLGDRVGLGSGCLIMDNDSHSLNPLERFSETANIRSSPVILEEDVWVGARAILLKGTRIGARSIVQAGSVVQGKFDADCIIGGNPAVIIGSKRI